MADQVAVPDFPVMVGALGEVPEKVKKEWRETYVRAHKQSQLDSPNEPSLHAQRARRAANALLDVRKPANYEEAMELPDWQVVKREGKEGRLVLVTIDGRGPEPTDPEEPRSAKFIFAIPAKAAKGGDKGKDGGG